MLNVSPEMATDENYAYVDCSSYVNSIYHYAFGIDVFPGAIPSTTNTKNLMLFAESNLGINTEVIDYFVTSSYIEQTDKDNKLLQVWNNLEIGDLIVYRYDDDSLGHVLIYMGNDIFLHATGSSYDYNLGVEKTEATGAIKELAASLLFSTVTSSRYLFRPEVNKVCHLRPLNRGNITISSYALSRARFTGLDVEKVGNVDLHSAVGLGTSITYSIRLNNYESKPIYNIHVIDELSQYVTLSSLSSGGIYADHHVSFSIPILTPNQTVYLQYTVQVSDNVNDIGKTVESNGGQIRQIVINPLYYSITGLDETDYRTLTELIDDYANSSIYENSMELIQNIFSAFSSTASVTNTVLEYTTLINLYNSTLSISFLYGGLSYDRSSTYNQDLRIRLLRMEHLDAGDIIMCYTGSLYNVYIFGGSYLISYDSSTGNVNYYTETEANNILISVNSYETFKVIRPAKTMRSQ